MIKSGSCTIVCPVSCVISVSSIFPSTLLLCCRPSGITTLQDLVKNFLFNGVDELGSKTFLDYFPEYQCEDGTVNEKRSIIGKSFDHRPWDAAGEFVGNNFR